MKTLTARFAISLLSIAALGGCDGGGSSSVQAPKANIPPIVFERETDLQAALGVVGGGDALLKKRLGTSKGGAIEIKQMYVWSYDGSDWERGGNLYLLNDYSLGREGKVVCSVSPQIGDQFMASKKRRDIAITGTIKDYSSSDGLLIEPCLATW
jgi:hypothetical protein